ncbi:universal stress protein [Pedobacter sp. NJ-S-72]
MGTIIVTTDQSVNSKSAIRFAINLAGVRNADLIVLHAYHIVKPFSWSGNAYLVYKETFLNQTRLEITAFMKNIIKSMNLIGVNFRLVTFFTHQSRSFLEKLMLPSNAAEYSFYSRIPIISFKKE